MLHLAAIGVENAVAKVRVRALRALEHQHLVAADAEMPVREAPQLLTLQAERLARGVEHDEIVARALHLGEGDQRQARSVPHTCRSCSSASCG